MTMTKTSNGLVRLIDLRERDVERLTAEVAAKQAVRERYLGNLARLEQLRDSTGASGALPPVLSLNCAAYKQSVMLVADAHRADLRLHEADMALSQQALQASALRREVLGQVHARQCRELRRAQEAGEQKRQDELASQLWWRGRR
ncbi:flagellar FliJ family protein [Aromatoleum sp.]|uniref:flagellar FliJ family protein n=1 Tax=Aromatoleum sp. TaxID=2307007 RepID=UPI003FA5F831